MVEKTQQDSEEVSETLYTKVIPKMNKAGSRQVGSITIEVKTFAGAKFIQLTQNKSAYGFQGSPGYKPEKNTWVTFDPSNKDLKDALSEAYKK